MVTVDVQVSSNAEITYALPEWAKVIDEGKEDAVVDSETIELPQGGTAPSNAAVIHGQTFYGTSETGSNFIENGYKKINTLLPELVGSFVSGGMDLSSIEAFLTSVVKADVEGPEDNANEKEATDIVINSIRVVVTIYPSPEEIKELFYQKAVEAARRELVSKIQGVFS